jgi:hypothetical protein
MEINSCSIKSLTIVCRCARPAAQTKSRLILLRTIDQHGAGSNTNRIPMNRSMLRQASAFVPLAMSFAALALVLWQSIVSGSVRDADEGAAAHVFQLLIVGQAPFAAWFALKWLPREPGDAMLILALQAASAVAALIPVVILGL